jgi:hypothetical protein
MIFFGRKSTTLKTGHINHVSCPDCQEQTRMDFTIMGKYAHIWWIPAFPMGKEKIIECTYCFKTYKFKELPEVIKQKLALKTQDVKSPIWNYTGLIIFTMLLGLAFYQSNRHNAKQDGLKSDPKIGDIYTIKRPNSNYSTMKIEKVTTDSIYFSLNNLTVTKTYRTHTIDHLENYDFSRLESYHKSKVLELIDLKKITGIQRD